MECTDNRRPCFDRLPDKQLCHIEQQVTVTVIGQQKRSTFDLWYYILFYFFNIQYHMRYVIVLIHYQCTYGDTNAVFTGGKRPSDCLFGCFLISVPQHLQRSYQLSRSAKHRGTFNSDNTTYLTPPVISPARGWRILLN